MPIGSGGGFLGRFGVRISASLDNNSLNKTYRGTRKWTSNSSKTFRNMAAKSKKALNSLLKTLGRLATGSRKTSKAFDDISRSSKKAEAGFKRTAKAAKKTNKELERAVTLTQKFRAQGEKLSNIGKKYTLKVSLPTLLAGGALFKIAADHEVALTGVAKTTELAGEKLEKLNQEIIELSHNIPVTANDLLKVAENAAQMGVARDKLVPFTDTVVRLAEASADLTSETAAFKLAQFINVTGLPVEQVDNLASTIVYLGNTTATTEGKILEMMHRLSGIGSIVGIADAEIASIAATLQSFGVEAELGGSAITRFFLILSKEITKGNEAVGIFAGLMDKTTAEFEKMFREDPTEWFIQATEALNKFTKGGGNVTALLDALKLSGVRITEVTSKLTVASAKFRENMEKGRKSFAENTELYRESERAFATVWSDIQEVVNQIITVFRIIGRGFLMKPIKRFTKFLADKVLPHVREFAKWMGELNDKTKAFILVAIGIVTIVAPILLITGLFIKMSVALIGLVGSALFVKTAIVGAFALVVAALIIYRDEIKSLFMDVKSHVTSTFNDVWEEMKTKFNSFVEYSKEKWNEFSSAITSPFQGWKDDWTELWDDMVSYYEKAVNWMSNLWNKTIGKILPDKPSQTWLNMVENANKSAEELKKSVEETNKLAEENSLISYVNQPVEVTPAAGVSGTTQNATGATDTTQNTADASDTTDPGIKAINDRLKAMLRGSEEIAKQAGKEGGFLYAGEFARTLAEGLKGNVDGIKSAFQSILDKLALQWGEFVTNVIVKYMEDALRGTAIGSFLSSVVNPLAAFATGVPVPVAGAGGGLPGAATITGGAIQTGGYKTYASGGIAKHGMYELGERGNEFVMNSKSTKEYLPELRKMNAGKFDKGGEMYNVTVNNNFEAGMTRDEVTAKLMEMEPRVKQSIIDGLRSPSDTLRRALKGGV